MLDARCAIRDGLPDTVSGIGVSLQMVFAVVVGGLFVSFGPTAGAVITILLTEGLRIGFGTKAVITGDVTQIDLARGQKSGLVEADRILADVRGIAFTEFSAKDVVRHPLVARIVDAYNRGGKS